LVGRWREPWQADITLSNWALVRSHSARRVGGGIFGQGTVLTGRSLHAGMRPRWIARSTGGCWACRG
jgi:hypothetical protein